MNTPYEILLVISSIGAIQSYFLGFYILAERNKRHVSNIMLGFLFITLGIRVTKSVLWAFWSGTPEYILNFGFSAHAFVGPLTLLYVYFYSDGKKEFKKINLIHFLPAVILLLFSFSITIDNFWYKGGYTLLLYYQLLYMAASFVLLLKMKSNLEAGESAWLRNLLIGISIWGLAYFSNYVLGWTSYMLGPILYSVIIYLISFYGLRHEKFLANIKEKARYKNINLSNEEKEKYFKKIVDTLESGNPYLNPSFNLTELSKLSSIPSHVISFVLSEKSNSGFKEVVNGYRIAAAKEMLVDKNFENHKISSIAFECGFNSLSAFNAAFKKITNQTPSEFKSNNT